MTSIAVRKSGGASIVSIPKVVLKTLGIKVGSRLNLSIEDNKIVLSPVEEELTLEALLEGSPAERLVMTDEDKEWLGMLPAGKEI
ncbi:AbrB/MazE/SpoVT family DNA-binding domain-containing protein [Endozoicomonas sp. 8E]|uniref:AbrB/MazE/SpoVT family DNA-binding domain-containing protein n=1 Tax=Endozoicomonas sp. 8E TaxID=3035692 RepID=UPI002938FC0F|nr:AbrB/MazE/SpoVT family DNA-binding domain-containing protein [Endozoicomonas sp. 8E]WOG28511.1 AbrB/MazE/SpoVT family DNA-binding domain-containing protein [Endozoicomonas sp. 8E]